MLEFNCGDIPATIAFGKVVDTNTFIETVDTTSSVPNDAFGTDWLDKQNALLIHIMSQHQRGLDDWEIWEGLDDWSEAQGFGKCSDWTMPVSEMPGNVGHIAFGCKLMPTDIGWWLESIKGELL